MRLRTLASCSMLSLTLTYGQNYMQPRKLTNSSSRQLLMSAARRKIMAPSTGVGTMFVGLTSNGELSH